MNNSVTVRDAIGSGSYQIDDHGSPLIHIQRHHLNQEAPAAMLHSLFCVNGVTFEDWLLRVIATVVVLFNNC